jgi:hypothetical protein
MKKIITGVVAIVSLCSGSLLASLTAPTSAKKLTGKCIDMFNAKAQTIAGRENLKHLIDVEKQVQRVLNEEASNKKIFSKAEIKTRTETVVTPLRGYFQALFPGRNVSKDILKLSIMAHDPSGRELNRNFLLQFFNKNDLASMNKFFQETIIDHAHLMRVCREFATLAGDIKKSLSPAAKSFYRLKYGAL